jgi:glycosyltransferase involved in cell wall biosynthesis
MKPKVSVIIPAYQCADYLGEAIDSALNQTYANLEVVAVYDEGCTDRTLEVLEGYDDRIRIIRMPHGGISTARNTGIRTSAGEYIALLDGDDVWLKDKLDLQMQVFIKKPETGLVFSDMVFFTENGELQQSSFSISPPFCGNVLEQLFRQNFIPTSTVVVRKKKLEESGCFDVSLSGCEDYDLWLRMAGALRIDFVSRVLAKYRLRADSSASDVPLQVKNLIKVKTKILAAHPELWNQPQKILEFAYLHLFTRDSKYELRAGRKNGARSSLEQYRQVGGSEIRYWLGRLLMILPIGLIKLFILVWDKLFFDWDPIAQAREMGSKAGRSSRGGKAESV